MYVQILQLKLKLADQQRVNTQAATQQAAVIQVAAQQQAQQQAIVLAAQQQGVEQAQKARQNASLMSLLSGKENHHQQQQQQQNISLLDMLNKNMGRGNSSYSPHSGLVSFTSSGLGGNSNRQLSPSVSLTDLLANRYRGY